MNVSPALLASASFVAATFPSPAFAVDTVTRSAARQLGYEGIVAYRAGDFDTAIERLERAYAALPAPSLALWLGRALEKNGRLVEASERFLEATRLSVDAGSKRDVQRKAQEEALAERQSLLARLPSLTVHVTGVESDEVRVSVAGVALPVALVATAIPTDPGEVEVVVERGGDVQRKSITLRESERASLHFRFESAQPKRPGEPVAASVLEDAPPTPWQPTAGWIGVGAGGAAVLFGTVTAGLAFGKYDALDCPDDRCAAPEQRDDVDAYGRLRTMSSIGFVTGGVLAAVGGALLLTAPDEPATTGITAFVSGSSAGVRGRF